MIVTLSEPDMNVKGLLPFNILVICLLLTACTTTGHYAQRSDVQPFIAQMTTHYGFSRQEVESLLSQACYQPKVIRNMQRPHESTPWYKYRAIFLSRERAREGAEFWRRNIGTMTQAEREYGVPPEIISAIIGVETRYGQNEGNYRVLDALTTLAFDYPPRAKFFRSELAEYYLLLREEHFNPLNLTGSYAGAIGEPQFMPSSYRHYAVDYDRHGQRDLFHNEADVIGSVAYYFKEHGWLSGKAVTFPAQVKNPRIETLANQGVNPSFTLAEWARHGVVPGENMLKTNQEKAALLRLQGEVGPEYWLTMHNFLVITRYNKSPAYAMAVYQLSQMIKNAYQAKETTA